MSTIPRLSEPAVERSRYLVAFAVVAHTIGVILMASKALVALVTGEVSIPNAATGVPLVIQQALPLGLYIAGLALTAVFSGICIHVYLQAKKPAGALWWARTGVFVLGLGSTLAGVIVAMAAQR
ncbi:hypothetical protein [Hydrogenophaga sp.]|jgi:hypothetical protein|uniref:hypothetical protein n=1 Tax=Hydrogenophaga sp. TaxID=1904254 RepID=UPI0027248D83|nr:hypothetical protein [Hydrogenophaga sp.]MDO9134177.1 hypothetical protein [Hydrogenophaga sp.]